MNIHTKAEYCMIALHWNVGEWVAGSRARETENVTTLHWLIYCRRAGGGGRGWGRAVKSLLSTAVFPFACLIEG